MNTLRLTFLLLLLFPASALAAWEPTSLKAQGAECVAYERVVAGAARRGTRCVLPEKAIGGYPHPVTVHVPDYFVPTDALDVVLYIHGLSDHTKPLRYDYVDSLFVDDMGISLAMSGANAVLVMPGGTAGNRAFKRHLTATAARFDTFMQALQGHLQRAGLSARPALGRFVVAGHSGAHRPLRQILTADCAGAACIRDQIQALYLLDASYLMTEGGGDPFTAFARRPGKRLHVVFRGGTIIAENSRHLYNQLHGTDLRHDGDFCRAHATDLTGPVPCQFACVSNRVLKEHPHWKRGPSVHYRLVPTFLWRLLRTECP